MIEDWSHVGPGDRLDLLDEMIDDICPETQADFDWAEVHLGMSAEDCLGLFVNAPKLGLLRAPDGKPLYLFAFNPALSTFSTSRRRAMGMYLTKHILRWARTPEGDAFFRGTSVLADAADVDASFGGAWVRKMGYTFVDSIRLPTGPTINRYRYEGA